MNVITFYWINLDKATERRNFMENQFKEKNLKNKRITAISPETLNEYLEDEPPYFCGYIDCAKNNCKDCIYEYSTLCSHLKAIKKAYDDGDNYFIICEDDININFKLDIYKLLLNKPPDYDIIQMMVIGAGHLEYFYYNYYKKNIQLIKYNPITPSAAYYIISRNGAKKILDMYFNEKTNKFNFKNTKFLRLADVLIFQSVQTCVLTFPLCIPNIEFKSQIHQEHFDWHKNAYEKIKEIQEDYKSNIYIIDKL